MIPEGPSHPHTVAPHLRLSCPWSKGGVQGSKAGGTVSGLVLNSSSSFASGAWDSTHSDFIHLGVFLSLLPGPLTLIFTLSLMSGPFPYSDPAAGDVEPEDLGQANNVVVLRAC